MFLEDISWLHRRNTANKIKDRDNPLCSKLYDLCLSLPMRNIYIDHEISFFFIGGWVIASSAHMNITLIETKKSTYNWITPLWRDAQIHGRTGWKARPLTRADLLSNLVSMVFWFTYTTRLLPIFVVWGWWRIDILILTGFRHGCVTKKSDEEIRNSFPLVLQTRHHSISSSIGLVASFIKSP